MLAMIVPAHTILKSLESSLNYFVSKADPPHVYARTSFSAPSLPLPVVKRLELGVCAPTDF